MERLPTEVALTETTREFKQIRAQREAERRKRIDLITAQRDAERDAVRIRIAAEADRTAAGDRGAAVRAEAEAEADADKVRSLAARVRHEVEAEGVRLMNEAQNLLTPDARQSAMRMRLIEKLDAIIRESVKPRERIEGIKMLQVDGIGAAAARGRAAGRASPTAW